MSTIWIAFYDAEALPLETDTLAPRIILKTSTAAPRCGTNSLLVPPESLLTEQWFGAGLSGSLPAGTFYEAGELTRDQRRLRVALHAQLARAAEGVWQDGLVPLLYGIHRDGSFQLYFAGEVTATECSALRCAGPLPAGPDTHRGFADAIAAAGTDILKRQQLFNTGRTYSQWRPDLEMERKYTYHDIPDTWLLANTLYEELRTGVHEGFFPEPHMGFQVFDYDNFIFDVTGPAAEAGYISFIPQVDGLVTVKRKWFEENAEIRRESVWPNEQIPDGAFGQAATARVNGQIERLPPFRRKRFDINFESIETGHIYGVYFDICRIIGEPAGHGFGQVEVEYCRSRTVLPLADVMPEYEHLCGYVDGFLHRHGVDFEQNLYSKLDFSRAARALAATGA